MCAFDIDSNKVNQLSAGSTFGAVQAMQKKQEEADAKKAQEKNSLLQDDTVSISDEAKLIINSQLGKLAAKGNLMDAASASGFVKQVRKAQDDVNEKNAAKNGGEAEIDATESEEGKSADMGAAIGGVREEKTKMAKEMTEEQINKLKEDIQDKQAEIGKAMAQGGAGAEAKVEMLQKELVMLQNMLISMLTPDEE